MVMVFGFVVFYWRKDIKKSRKNKNLPPPYGVQWNKKEERNQNPLLFPVPYDILFSNKYLRDLGRIWELREIVPDPNNMPWIEKIDK